MAEGWKATQTITGVIKCYKRNVQGHGKSTIEVVGVGVGGSQDRLPFVKDVQESAQGIKRWSRMRL